MQYSTKGQTFPPEIYSADEMTRLLRAPSTRAPTGIRNRALMTMGYRAGLRLAEVLDLYPKDIDTRTGVVTVLHGKGNRSRTVGLDPGACGIIDRWIDQRQAQGLNGTHRLFCTLRGEPVDSSYVRVLMHRLGRRAGLEKRVHFHGLRHTFAW